MVRTNTNDRKSKKKNRQAIAGFENLESRRLMAAVDTFSLINADTDKTIMTLTPGCTINLATLPTTNLNVRANATGKPESVRFSLDSKADFYTDNNAAFAMARNRGSDYLPWNFTEGSHGLSAYPYAGDDATGKRGVKLTVMFNVINEPVSPPNDLYSLTVSKSQVNGGESLSVNWSATGTITATDWIGLYRVGAPNSSFLWWDYTDGAASGSRTLTAPSAGGTYELRYLTNDKLTSVATSPSFSVTASEQPPSNPGDRPDETNTGPTDRSVLRMINGVLTITEPGVYENFDVTGGISIYASNVTLRNFVSRDNIKVYDGTNVLIEDGEVYSNTGSDGLSIHDTVLRRLHIHNVHDGIRISENVTIEGCYIHDVGGPGGHSDGLQAAYATPSVTIRGNYFVVGDCTSCLNNVHNWTVEGNWFSGGQYTMYMNPDATSPTVINNVFYDIHASVVRSWPSSGTWSGNINGDTGMPIS